MVVSRFSTLREKVLRRRLVRHSYFIGHSYLIAFAVSGLTFISMVSELRNTSRIEPAGYVFFASLLALPFGIAYLVRAFSRVTSISEINMGGTPKYRCKLAIIYLRSRARHLRVFALLMLVLMLVALGGGISIFLSADKNAQNENSQQFIDLTEMRGRNKAFIKFAELIELSKGKDVLDKGSFEDLMNALNSSSSPQDPFNRIARMNPCINQKIACWAVMKEKYAQELSDSDSVVKFIANKPEESVYKFWISTLGVKIGSIAVVLFLVQLLSSLYRYNIRMAAYYDARADAILLSGALALDSLKKLSEILSPEMLDFSKTPETPWEKIIETAGKLTGKKD
jgi:uncharacterized protein YpmB